MSTGILNTSALLDDDAPVLPRRSASAREIVLVLGLPVGLFFSAQTWRAVTSGADQLRPFVTNARLLPVIGVEIGLAVGLLWWLRRREWRPQTELGRPSAWDAARGLVLWMVTFGIGRLVVMALRELSPSVMAGAGAAPLEGALSWWAVGLALAVNPLFEEALWLGYAVPQLERRIGLWGALLFSLVLRTAVHYNQGALALVSVLPVGLVFTLYYARWRRIWPVVVAHIIVNAFGLGAMINGSS